MASEHQAAVGAEHAGLVRDWILRLGDNPAGAHVERPHGAMRARPTLLLAAHAQPDPVLVLVHRGPHDGAARAALGARHVGDHALGVEGRREEGRRAAIPRAGFLPRLAAPLTEPGIALHIAGRIVVERLAGLRIDALGPGHLLLILVGA